VTPGGGNPPFLTTVLRSTGRGSVRFLRFDEGSMRPVHPLFDVQGRFHMPPSIEQASGASQWAPEAILIIENSAPCTGATRS